MRIIWEWFSNACAKDIPVNGNSIQEKALVQSINMGHDNSSASNGWLESWQKHHAVSASQLCGEAADVPLAATVTQLTLDDANYNNPLAQLQPLRRDV